MEEQNPDNPDHHEPSVIEKFRQQEKRQLKYLLASLGLFLFVGLNVLMDILFISLKSNPTWRSWMLCLMVFFAVGIIVLGIISFAMGLAPHAKLRWERVSGYQNIARAVGQSCESRDDEKKLIWKNG